MGSETTGKLRLLDLFCGAGGCARGYQRAGFYVVGIDNRPQLNYCGDEFIQGDALEFCRAHAHSFDAIHASPPCQAYSSAKSMHADVKHPDLVNATRLELERARLPWVIENVMGSPLHRPIMLCGLMFGLGVLRHRLFESSEMMLGPAHKKHPSHLKTGTHSSRRKGPGTGYSTGEFGLVCVAGNNFPRLAGMAAMGIDWHMTRKEVANAIPPAYTEYIGKQLIRVCQKSVA